MTATIYTVELGERVCEMIAEGKSLTEIAAADGMPNKSTVLRWASKDEEFRVKYEAAMALRIEGIVEGMIEIADSDRGPRDKQVMLDARKWIAGRFIPSKYGTKVTNVMENPDGTSMDTAPRFVVMPPAAKIPDDDTTYLG